MIGLGQASWFLDKLEFRYPEIDRESAYDPVHGLSDDKYFRMKQLFFEAFASGGGKKENPVAQAELKLQLINLGVKFHERVAKI